MHIFTLERDFFFFFFFSYSKQAWNTILRMEILCSIESLIDDKKSLLVHRPTKPPLFTMNESLRYVISSTDEFCVLEVVIISVYQL